MTTQVMFKIDKKLKDKAMKKAKNQGLPFGIVLKLATKAFVEGTFNIGLIPNEILNPATDKAIHKILKDIKEGSNLSPRFSSAKEAIAYLKS